MRKIWRPLLVILPLLLLVKPVLWYNRKSAFNHQYYLLEVGMSDVQVNQIFGKVPDYSCGFGSMRIVYFFRDRPPADEALPKEPVETKDDIPYIYAAAQILLDGERKVRAYTQNGESVYIFTGQGKYKGDHLKKLDDSFFERVTTDRQSATERTESTEEK